MGVAVESAPPLAHSPQQLREGRLDPLLMKNTSKPSNSSSGTLQYPDYDGEADSVTKDTAKTVWELAYTLISSAPASIDKNSSHYVTWFGKKEEGHVEIVKGQFEIMKKAMEDNKYIVYFKGPECERDEFVLTAPDSTYIVLCESYLRAENTRGYNSKLGTFVWALAVSAAKLEGVPRIDTPMECRDLAVDVPLRAIENAFNYEYFTETLPVPK